MRWAVELGQIDIHLPVSLLAQHLAAPRLGHLNQVYYIFAYLKGHASSQIIMGYTVPLVDTTHFPILYRKNYFNPDASEAIPSNAAILLGNPIVLSCFVDADHAGNKVTRSSNIIIILFCNREPIYSATGHQLCAFLNDRIQWKHNLLYSNLWLFK